MNGGYSKISIWLHWATLILLISVYSCIELRVLFEKGTDARNLIKTFHYFFGMLVFVVVFFRLIARVLSPKVSRENYGELQRWSSTCMFFALYGLMILMPILGYILISAEGNVVNFVSIQLPLLDIKSNDLAHQIEEIHEILGKVGYGLIALHSLAGLFHYFVLNDQTMYSKSKQ